MSRLSEMIKELCPNGVEYRKLGEVCNLVAGGDVPKNRFSEHITDEYSVPVYSNGVEEKSLYGYTDIPAITEPCVTISARGTIGYAALRIKPFFPVIRLICVIPDESINVRFLLHVLKMSTFRSPQTGIPQLTIPMVKKHLVPVPPLPIQNEIVKLLDNFTELTAELTAELALRKKQYNFYRDSLLNFSRDDTAVTYEGGDEVSWYLTGDIFNLQNGYTPSKKQPSYWENGTIPWYRMEDIRTNGRILYDAIQHIHPSGVKSSLYPANSLLMATTATIGEYALLMKPSLSNQQMTNFSIKEEFQEILNIKFAFYYFHVFAVWCKKNANQSGGMPIITVAKLKTFSFPIPPLDVQQKIVSILDRFDTLCNDLSQGLPAEIAARKKQYEYYRDKLLTFRHKRA